MANPVTENLQLANLIASLSGTVFGQPKKTTTESSTAETKQTMVDPANILKLLAQNPETGVASAMAQGKRAGIYGGSSSAMNINDLLSQIGTKAAVAAAPTVTSPSSKTGTIQQKGMIDPMTGALMAAGLLIASPSMRKKAGDIFGGLFGDDTAAAGTMVNTTTDAGASLYGGDFTPNEWATMPPAAMPGEYSALWADTGTAASDFTSTVSTVSDLAGGAGAASDMLAGYEGYAAMTDAADAAAGLAGAADLAGTAGDFMVPGVGTAISKVFAPILLDDAGPISSIGSFFSDIFDFF